MPILKAGAVRQLIARVRQGPPWSNEDTATLVAVLKGEQRPPRRGRGRKAKGAGAVASTSLLTRYRRRATMLEHLPAAADRDLDEAIANSVKPLVEILTEWPWCPGPAAQRFLVAALEDPDFIPRPRKKPGQKGLPAGTRRDAQLIKDFLFDVAERSRSENKDPPRRGWKKSVVMGVVPEILGLKGFKRGKLEDLVYPRKKKPRPHPGGARS